jgi:hypothetical protein
MYYVHQLRSLPEQEAFCLLTLLYARYPDDLESSK